MCQAYTQRGGQQHTNWEGKRPGPTEAAGTVPAIPRATQGRAGPTTSGLWRLGNTAAHRGRCLEPAREGGQELRASPQVGGDEVLACPPTCSCRWGKSQRSGNQTPRCLGILILHWTPTQAAQGLPRAISSQPLGRDGWAEVSHYGSWLSGLCGQKPWT